MGEVLTACGSQAVEAAPQGGETRFAHGLRESGVGVDGAHDVAQLQPTVHSQHEFVNEFGCVRADKAGTENSPTVCSPGSKEMSLTARLSLRHHSRSSSILLKRNV